MIALPTGMHNRQPNRLLACIALIFLLTTGGGQAGTTVPFPALDPPRETLSLAPQPKTKPSVAKDGPNREWTFHKSIDGAHPSGVEQQLLWLMNRARRNPASEGHWLATMTDPDIVRARSFFQVDLTVLQNEFTALAAKPPAAFDIRLFNAAQTHTLDLIARNTQDHQNQFTRITDAGFHYISARGNVFAYAKHGLYCHAGWNIDWGPGDNTGMQPGRGHRQAVMSGDGNYTNVGIAAVPEDDPSTQVGPLVVTGNYAQANESFPDHYNVFIVGTVWQDINKNNQYDPGEGLGNITVRPDHGTYYAITGSSGGYALPLTDAGTYRVTFSGSGLPQAEIRRVDVTQTTSMLLDLLVTKKTNFWTLMAPIITGQTTGRDPKNKTGQPMNKADR